MARGRAFTTAAIVIAAAVLTTAALGATAVAPRRYRADLTAANEVPAPQHVPKNAGGRFTAELKGHTLSWTLKFHALGGKVTAADIHLGAKGQAGPVLVPLCGPCTSPADGTVKLTGAEIAALGAGKAYVDVHTVKNPNGEVRGQAYKR